MVIVPSRRDVMGTFVLKRRRMLPANFQNAHKLRGGGIVLREYARSVAQAGGIPPITGKVYPA